MEWIRKWRKNGVQIGEDRKCWPLQSLQTKRICEACTSSLFPLKEEPVSTFLCAEKLALALHVTSAVFLAKLTSTISRWGVYVKDFFLSPISLFHSSASPPPPCFSHPLSICLSLILPLSFLHFTILFLSPSRCFKAHIILSVSPLPFFFQSLSPKVSHFRQCKL